LRHILLKLTRQKSYLVSKFVSSNP